MCEKAAVPLCGPAHPQTPTERLRLHHHAIYKVKVLRQKHSQTVQTHKLPTYTWVIKISYHGDGTIEEAVKVD